MLLKLYKMDLSPPAGAALMICEIHKIPVEMIDVDLIKQENLKPEYQEKNPLHTIPLLEDDDLIIHDSHAILTYLTDKYGKDESLYPKDLKKRAQVDQKLFFDTLLFHRFRSITYSAIFEGLRKPTEKQLKDLDEAYSFLDAFLSKTKFIAGDNMTIADVSILASVAAIRHIIPIDGNKYPHVQSWFTHMSNQSFFKNCAEPGSITLGEILKARLDLMPLKLYKMDISPPVCAALMICDIHNVPVEKIDVNFLKLEQFKPDYVKKNPIHTVPLLEDDDLSIHDSHVILTYLTEKYGKDESLYPKDLKKRAQVDQKLFLDTLIFFRMRAITTPAFFEGARKPTEKQLKDLEEAYKFLEAFLSKTKFVAGDNMTIADISLLATFNAVRYIIPMDFTKYPKVHDWFSHMKSQSFYKKIIEPVTAELEKIVKEILDL
ncbi:glutathione S-transferase theta-2-like [Melitaea cinxia]|uniref:glutathione S-transferase theta-2-like n=1 Tax=Melitaea cinxia TaxID=113334 RepID=UPI001E270D7C|nr:glutathione S-transferase theta-2-like [Melitaea cinxia]